MKRHMYGGKYGLRLQMDPPIYLSKDIKKNVKFRSCSEPFSEVFSVLSTEPPHKAFQDFS